MSGFRRGIRLAVDVGKARVGVAQCDPDGMLATPTEKYKVAIKKMQSVIIRHLQK